MFFDVLPKIANSVTTVPGVTYYSCYWIPLPCSVLLPDNSRLAKGPTTPSKPHLPFFFSTSFPPLLFPSNAFAAGQSAVTGEQWLTVSVCKSRRNKCERVEGKQVKKEEIKPGSEQHAVFGFDKIQQIYWHILWCQVFPLSKSTVTAVLLCLCLMSLCPSLQLTNKIQALFSTEIFLKLH